MMTKGQAAFEFLTTYGLALLMVAMAIAAMSAFFLSNPDTLVPQRCEFQADFNCQDYGFFQDTSDAKFVFEAVNIQGRTINITEITCEYMDGEFSGRINDVHLSLVVTSGEVFNATCLDMPLSQREIANVRINVKFVPDGNVFNTTTVGSATVGVQEE